MRVERRMRVRKKVFGTPAKPRFSVFRSNRYVYGQLIDDTTGKTLVSLSGGLEKKLHGGKPKIWGAFEVGAALAEIAKKKGITTVVFDRNGYKFHGRVKSCAEGARKGGL